jgi:hypothetical protein
MIGTSSPAKRRLSGRTVANLLTNLALDPFGKIPEFEFCAVRAKPVGIRTAAEQATAGINLLGPLSVGERRLRRDLVLRDDGFGPREIFQQALAGQDKDESASARVARMPGNSARKKRNPCRTAIPRSNMKARI